MSISFGFISLGPIHVHYTMIVAVRKANRRPAARNLVADS